MIKWVDFFPLASSVCVDGDTFADRSWCAPEAHDVYLEGGYDIVRDADFVFTGDSLSHQAFSSAWGCYAVETLSVDIEGW